MGSYLEIDGRETNSKHYSGILIDAIRELDKRAQSKPYIKEIQKYFVAEEYKEDGTGIGDWKIHRKGIACLVQYLNDLKYDEEKLVEMAKEEYKYQLHLCTEEKYDCELEAFVKYTTEAVEWCESYAIRILVDMVLNKRKRVKAIWV